MFPQKNKGFINVSAFDGRRGNTRDKTKKHVRNKYVKKIEEFTRSKNKNTNDKKVFPPKDQLECSDFKHSQLEECKQQERKLFATFPKDQKYEINEIQKPVFQNPAVEKYLNESMKKTLNRYKNHDDKWKNLIE